MASGAKTIPEAKRELSGELVPHVGKNTGNNEWYTPARFIEAAVEVLGAIDLDPASSPLANETVGAAEYFTVDDDGMSREWGGRVWMNPPYAQPLIAEFSAKLLAEVASGRVFAAIVLVNNATETKWGSSLLAGCDAVCFPSGRIRFIDEKGEEGAPLQGQMLLYFGRYVSDFESSFNRFGPASSWATEE